MQDDNKANYNVFIDVDSLFDTRLPILYGLSATTMSDYLNNGKYRTRVKDVFGDIPGNIFKGYYDNRDKRVLLAARPTEMFNLISEYIGTTYIAKTNIGDGTPIKVYLNTYPYELVDGEINAIAELVSGISNNMILEIVSMDNKDITPKWIENNVGAIIKYDSLAWIDYHIAYGTLPKTPLLDVIMMGPHLISGEMTSKDVTQDTFNTLLEGVNTLIGFSFIRTSYYCLMEPE